MADSFQQIGGSTIGIGVSEQVRILQKGSMLLRLTVLNMVIISPKRVFIMR